MQGYLETVLSQIAKKSGAPKGSLYCHFPEGKEQFSTQAAYRITQTIEQGIRTSLATIDDHGEAIAQLIPTLAHHIEATEFAKLGGIITVTLESITVSERIGEACKDT